MVCAQGQAGCQFCRRADVPTHNFALLVLDRDVGFPSFSADFRLNILTKCSAGGQGGHGVDGVDQRETEPERGDGRASIDHEHDQKTDRDCGCGELRIDHEQTDFSPSRRLGVSLALAVDLVEGDRGGKGNVGGSGHCDLSSGQFKLHPNHPPKA